jgi:heptosyltransferase-2
MADWFRSCRQLLVRAPNWLGDAVMCLPALEAARHAAPQAQVTLALPAHLAELFAAAEDVDAVLPIARRGAGPRSVLALAGAYREGKYDSALLLPNSFGSALAVWLARIARRAGYARAGRGWMLTDPVEADGRRRALHQVEYYFELVGALGAPADGFDRARRLRLAAPEAARARVRGVLVAERVRPEAPLVVLAPCAVGAGKEWPAERFGRLAALLWSRGAEVALVGAPAERPKTAAAAGPARAAGASVLDLAGRNSVAEMAALFELAAGFVGNDSGPLHLAGALGLPALGVFVSTDPARYRPLGPRTAVLGGPGLDPEPEAVAERLAALMGSANPSASPARLPGPESRAPNPAASPETKGR